ncbi:hypothetical protein ZHAS_00008201 [Anopheles sinensis]|uniref:Uncharacterized protein n=1 Tax=Anopheles sinensis TaxID=74873 RepID=A0A084VS27_ANOSI|nr:hypothetical protein ZHAS_00008201 [Anopheles sinensis]
MELEYGVEPTRSREPTPPATWDQHNHSRALSLCANVDHSPLHMPKELNSQFKFIHFSGPRPAAHFDDDNRKREKDEF